MKAIKKIYLIMRIEKLAIVLTSLLFIFFIPVRAQDSTALHYATFITPEIISKHLHVLASDSLEGRETSKPGMQKAAAYVSSQFESYGIQPINKGSYYQNIPLVLQSATAIDIVINNKLYEPGIDFYSTEMPADVDIKSDQIQFAGYGIVDSASGWNDYAGLDVTGKIVLIVDGEPFNKDSISLITNSTEPSSWKNDRNRKIQMAKDRKAAAVLFMINDFDNSNQRIKRWVSQARMNLVSKSTTGTIPVIYISNDLTDNLFAKASASLKKMESKSVKSGKSMAVAMKASLQIFCAAERISCTNVLGYVEGSDLKEELIVISAHLDHLGKRDDKIFYGADDDGSGCATIINMSEVFMKAKTEGKGPRRSILFITFSGEEKGLLGSEYYVNNPIFPLEKTVANLNIDMIGRVDEVQRNTNKYTYIIGSDKLSTDLHRISEEANRFCCQLHFDYKYNDPADKLKLYYRSDHYNFVKNNIPAIFYFTGLHEDYHKPTDTIDKIDFEKTTSIARLIFNTAWELANRTERIKVDVVNDFK